MSRSIVAEAAGPPLRAAFYFNANGAHWQWAPSGPGAAWVPAMGTPSNPSGLDSYTGPNYMLSPHLQNLTPVRSDITIIKNLILQRESGHPHRMATRSALGCGGVTSFDQVLAQAIGSGTPLQSLELSCDAPNGAGGFAGSLSQVNNVLIPGDKTGGTFLPGERNPVAAFQRVAPIITGGMMTGPMVNQALVARRSMLDYILGDITTFRARLGKQEQPKLDLYMQAVRDLENSLGGVMTGGTPPAAMCGTAMPPAVAANIQSTCADLPVVSRPFLDVMALALACGVTRVASFMVGGGEQDNPVPFMGMDSWHGVSHMDPGGSGGQLMIKMQNYLAGEFAYFVQKLKSYPDGTGTVLDNSVVVWGTQNGNSCQVAFSPEDHDRHNSPFVVAGKLGGAFKPGNLIDGAKRNHNDLYMAIAQGFGLPMMPVGNPAWCMGPLPGL
jgi:hypothetical protein